MSYNFIAFAKDKADWELINKSIMKYNSCIEYFPILENEINAVGFSIPINKISDIAWKELLSIFSIFHNQLSMKVIDLYLGEEVTESNYQTIKKTLLA